MKKLLLLICFFSLSSILTLNAQDRIVFRNADEVKAKVISITDNDVTYIAWDNLEGPSYTISKNNILFIEYKNGKKEVINADNNSAAKQPLICSNTPIVKFQGYANLGTIFAQYGAGPTFDITAGVRILDYFYAGIATGFHTYIETTYAYGYTELVDCSWAAYVPIGVNMKGYFTKNRKICPFVDFTIGGLIDVAEGVGGFHCQVGAGIDIKRFSMSFGYNNIYALGHLGYFKVGIRFGKGGKYW